MFAFELSEHLDLHFVAANFGLEFLDFVSFEIQVREKHALLRPSLSHFPGAPRSDYSSGRLDGFGTHAVAELLLEHLAHYHMLAACLLP